MPITGTGAATLTSSTNSSYTDTVDYSADVAVDGLNTPDCSFTPNSCGIAIADISVVTAVTAFASFASTSCDLDIIDSQVKRICRCLKAISFSSTAHAADAAVAIAADAEPTIATFGGNRDISSCDCYKCVAACSLQTNSCCTAALVAISTL